MVEKINKTRVAKWLKAQTKDSQTGQFLSRLSTALDDLVRWVYRLWPPHILHNRRQRALLQRFNQYHK